MADAQEVGAQWVEAFNAHDEGRMRELTADDGAVADTRLYYDQVQVMKQLGLMPEAATA
jgi:hypothetical protein